MLAEKLRQDLLDDHVLQMTGKIKFDLMGINTIVKTRSVVGDVIQDWLENYLQHKKYLYKNPEHTQQFPDFHLLASDGASNNEMLEVKCFDGARSANFDVANFEAYCQSLLDNPQRLDSYYLIFSYVMNPDTFEVSIKDVWLKRVWEITGPSQTWPVKFQVKKGVIYNIRPITWYSKRSKYKAFTSRKDFVNAMAKCIGIYTTTNHLHKANWSAQVASSYKRITGNDL